MPKPRVLVLYNEPVLPSDHPEAGSEHDVLDTARNTTKVLEAAGFDVKQLGVSYDPRPLLAAVRRKRPPVVFNLFEGLATQTGTEVSVAALLEWLNVPFTGCPSACLALGRDKVRTKHLLAAAGLPTPEYLVVEKEPVPEWPHPWPAIAKPACQDASVGIDQGSVVTSQEELAARVRHVLERYGGPVLVERFIDGREFHVNLVEAGITGERPVVVLPLAEIAFSRSGKAPRWPIYTYIAKWHEGSDEYKAAPVKFPVELPADAMERLRQIGEAAFRLLQCRDLARLDVRMTADGRFYVLEVNPNPYLNSSALISGLEAVGRTHERLIVDMALAAAARGGVAIRADAVTIPVGVSAGY
jgi:D-alanine-D-alanine ligase